MEKTITIELTEREAQALYGLIDAAVKATGINGAKAAMPLLAKIEAAAEDVNKEVKGGDDGVD